jgi:hypothetical protein
VVVRSRTPLSVPSPYALPHIEVALLTHLGEASAGPGGEQMRASVEDGTLFIEQAIDHDRCGPSSVISLRMQGIKAVRKVHYKELLLE